MKTSETNPSLQQHTTEEQLSAWTFVTIFQMEETYPVDIVFDPASKKIKKEPLPDAVTEVYDIKVPFVLLQLLSKIGIKRKYMAPDGRVAIVS